MEGLRLSCCCGSFFLGMEDMCASGDKVSSAGGAKEESVEEAKPWLVQEVRKGNTMEIQKKNSCDRVVVCSW